MALSGSSSVAVGSYWRVQLEWTATQSIVNNTSTVTANLYWIGDGGYSAISSSASKSFNITVNGNPYNGSGTAGLSAGQKKLLGSHTVAVPHNADGTKTFIISGTFNMGVTLSGVSYASRTTDGTYVLDTIPRASTYAISNQSLYTNGYASIWINRASTSYIHTVQFNFGSAEWFVYNVTSEAVLRPSDYATDAQWSSIIGQNAAYLTGAITIHTYLDTAQGRMYMGSYHGYAQLYLPDSYAPTAGTLTITELNTAVANLMGSTTSKRAVQTQSNLRFAVTGYSAGTGSVIDYVKITCDGAVSNYDNWNYGAPLKAQTYTVTWAVYDKRGRSATGSTTFVSYAYSLPKITATTIVRNQTTPTTAIIRYSGTVSSIKNASNVEKNTYRMIIDYKANSDASYTNVTSTSVVTGTALALTTYNQTNVSAAKAFTYRFEFRDALGNFVHAFVNLNTETVPLHISANGIGVGKRHESGALDVRGNAHIDGILTAANIAKGRVTITPSAPNTSTGVAVYWSLTGTPIIATGTNSAEPGSQVLGVGFSGQSSMGATFYLVRNNTITTDVHYICMSF